MNETAPPLGVTARARVDRVIDGDTVDVILEQKVRVRLLDCWAPEIRGEEKPEGLESKQQMEALLPVDSPVTVHVGTVDADEVQDVFTFGRVVGTIWGPNRFESINEKMIQSGHATRTKGGE